MLVNKSVVIYPLFGLLLSAHAARAVLETHLPGAALSALIVLFWLTYWDRNKKYWSHNEVIYIVLGALLLCYALLDTALRSWQPLLSFFELIIMILCLLALSSVRFSEKNFKLSFYPIIIFSVILSFLLITSRDSVFSLGINYLLLSLPLSIGVIYCYVYFIFSKRLMEILFFLTLTIILIFGLLQLQSRFNIIFILTFILLSTIINFISVRMNIRFAMLAFVSIAGVFLYFQFESLVAYNRLMNLVEDASSVLRLT